MGDQLEQTSKVNNINISFYIASLQHQFGKTQFDSSLTPRSPPPYPFQQCLYMQITQFARLLAEWQFLTNLLSNTHTQCPANYKIKSGFSRINLDWIVMS